MKFRWTALVSVVLLGSTLVAAEAFARSQISYGRITAVRQVNIENQGAQTAGTLVGGALGVASGSGQSRSNRALRGVGGAAVGSRLAGAAGSSTGFEYTVLIGGTNTIRITTEQAGLRVGDCVSVERGRFVDWLRVHGPDRWHQHDPDHHGAGRPARRRLRFCRARPVQQHPARA